MSKKIVDENGNVYYQKKPFYKKWWFWLLIVVIVMGFGNQGASTTSQSTTSKSETTATQEQQSKEMIVLDKKSPFRNIVTLNKGTDMPVDKILYKVSAGKYKATTDFEKVATLGVVKDAVTKRAGDSQEELNYVAGMHNITGKPANFNENLAKGEVIIEVGADESILIPNDNVIKIEKVK